MFLPGVQPCLRARQKGRTGQRRAFFPGTRQGLCRPPAGKANRTCPWRGKAGRAVPGGGETAVARPAREGKAGASSDEGERAERRPAGKEGQGGVWRGIARAVPPAERIRKEPRRLWRGRKGHAGVWQRRRGGRSGAKRESAGRGKTGFSSAFFAPRKKFIFFGKNS